MAHGLSSTLRALAWLRWRLFLNGAVHAMRRDMMRRFAGCAQPLTLAMMLLALVPSGIVLSGAAVVAGWAFADGELSSTDALPMLRISALFFVVGGLVMPVAYGQRSALPGLARLLLLPIERRWLHRMHYLAGLFEPFLLFLTFPVLLMPLGLAVGGRPGAAVTVFVAGVGLVLFEAGLGSWLYSLTVLVLRQRRRAQTLAVVAVAAVGCLAILPLLLEDVEIPAEHLETLWLLNLPGELYVGTVTGAVDGRWASALVGAAVLLGTAAGVFHLSRRGYRRVLLATSDSAAPAASEAKGPGTVLRLPGLADDAALVASQQLRMTLRTVVGKTMILQPTLMVVLFGIMLARAETMLPEFLATASPFLLLFGAAVLATLSPMSFQFNQFALDGSGATQMALLPLRPVHVVHGKAAAFFLVAAVSLAPSVLTALLFTRPAPATAVVGIVIAYLTLLISHLLLTPLAVVASALLPRSVNVNKPFSESQPHNLAVLASLTAGPLAVSLAGSLALAGLFAFDSLAAVIFLLVLWCVVTFLIARILLPVTAELYHSRREALLTVAQGR